MVQKMIYKDQLRNIRSLLFHFLKVRMFWMKNTNTNPNNYTNKKQTPIENPLRSSNVLDQLIHQTVQSWATSLCSVRWNKILRVQVSRKKG